MSQPVEERARRGPVQRWAWVHWSLPVLLVAAYVVCFSLLSFQERAALYQFDEDLAISDQTVWNTSRGRLFANTMIQHADNMLGDHFSPVLALFAPLYWIRPSAKVLLLAQTLSLALAALPLYAFAQRRAGAVAATLVVGAYLVYPALHFVNLYQFHEITLLALPLAVALLSIERGWRRLFFAAALAALTVKEEVAIVVVGLGLVWWLRRRDWRMGALATALGVAVGALTMGVILPHFNTADSGYYYVRRYAYLGNSPAEIALTALTSPGLVLAQLTSPDRLLFLAQLFGPLALLPLLGWEYLAAALPVFAYLLLSESSGQYAINRHYLVPLLPFLFFGAVVGLKRVETGAIAAWSRLRSMQPAVVLAGLLLAVSATSSYLIGPTPPARAYDARGFAMTLHSQQVRRLLEQIPPDASVSASRNLLSWLSHRERVYRFPEVREADYVLLDWRELRHPTVFQMDDGAFASLLASPDYRLADSAGATVLLTRGDPTAWQSTGQAPTRFGGEIELLGYRLRMLSPDPAVELTLYWRAIAPPSKPYTVFVHLLGDGDARLGQHDSWPLDNLYPTNLWQPGRVVPDTHTIEPQRPIPVEGFRLQVGLYELPSGARLPITERGLPGGSNFVEIVAP